MEYIACFYALDFYSVQDRTLCGSKLYGIRPLVACLPAWWRFSQSLRRYHDTKQKFPHLANAGKYSTTFFVVFFSTIATTRKEMTGATQLDFYFFGWVVSAFVSTCYTFFWDIKMDWGLLERENNLLRANRMFKHKSCYYFAMVGDLVLRFSWILTISIGEAGLFHSEVLKGFLAVFEIFRRFIWNFFRVENEHINRTKFAVSDHSIDELQEYEEEDEGGNHDEFYFTDLFDVYTKVAPKSCSHAKFLGYHESKHYVIDPDGPNGAEQPFSVYCNMTSHNGIGVTVVSHNSEARTLVDGCEANGCYRRDVVYDGISSDQLRALTSISTHCEQYIKYECVDALLLYHYGDSQMSWLVSRDGRQMKYWGGASRDSGMCACGMTGSCAKNTSCNCDANEDVWLEDSGLLNNKEDLPVISLRYEHNEVMSSDSDRYRSSDFQKKHNYFMEGADYGGFKLVPSELYDFYFKPSAPKSCSHAKFLGYHESKHYVIDPDGPNGAEQPFSVYCNMTSHNGIGVTVVSHNSEARTLVIGCESNGCYRRDVVYDGISSDQLRALTSISTHCEQYIKYECMDAVLLYYYGDSQMSWLVSRDGRQMKYWGGASRDSGMCACGMTQSCASNASCNCDVNGESVWREDSGFLNYKEDLPVISLRYEH
ncbi:hypothetical protein QZH41_012272, partial [Actinostola sp. cb2023]